MLVKYSMFKFLETLGLNATIITPNITLLNFDLSFMKEAIKDHLFFVSNNFSDIMKNISII